MFSSSSPFVSSSHRCISFLLFSLLFIFDSSIYCVNSLYLSSWSEIGTLSFGVTQHSVSYDNENNQIFTAGGIISSTLTTNKFQSIKLDIDENNNVINILNKNSTNYHASEMDFQFSLSQFYQHHQSSGFYQNKIFIVEPFYGGDFESLYFLSCDTISQQCKFITDLDDSIEWNYFQPCVTQKDEYLYIIGGINGIETTNNILIFDMKNEQFLTKNDNSTLFENFGPLQNGQVYTGCSICNDKLYVIGGDCNGQIATNHIQQCDDNGRGQCQTLNVHLSTFIRWPRAICVNDQVKYLNCKFVIYDACTRVVTFSFFIFFSFGFLSIIIINRP